MGFRIEKDFLGKKKVPLTAFYGIHSVRSLENFSIGSKKIQTVFLKQVFELKKANAMANLELGFLEQKKAKAIVHACNEAITGKFSDQFLVNLFQAGSATSTHMNANEVLANRATELLGGKKGQYLVHPNDDVNKGQSTNDVVPTAIKMALLEESQKLENALMALCKELEGKQKEFAKIIKGGRTHLQDAVPVTLGQEFGAYAASMKKHLHKIRQAKLFLLELAIGGNAIGTGINTVFGFREKVIRNLCFQTKKKFIKAKNGLEQVQFFSDVCFYSATMSCIAVDLFKICSDLKLLASGPNTGFGEIFLPAIEPGSSIMPGKINPSIQEAVCMACIQTMSNHYAVSLSAMNGQLELNTFMPLIAFNAIDSVQLLESSCLVLAKNVKGIKANKKKCQEFALKTPSIATALSPFIGYEKASIVVRESLKTGKTLLETVVQKGFLEEKKARQILDPKKLLSPKKQ